MLNTPKKIKDAWATKWRGMHSSYRPVRWIGVLAALAIFWFASVSAHADQVVVVNLSNLTFIGNSVCGPSGTGTGTSPCTETFNASLLWDNTTQALVSNSAQSTAAGPLGTFSLGPPGTSGFIGFGPPPTNVNFLYVAEWVTAGATSDTLVLNLSLTTMNVVVGIYPLVATDGVLTGPSQSVFGLACGTQTCITDFIPPNPLVPNITTTTTGFVAVSPVPEPGTLFLFGTGLLGVLGRALPRNQHG